MAGRHIQTKREPREKSRPQAERSRAYAGAGYAQERYESRYERARAADDRGGKKWLRWAVPVLAVLALMVAALGGVMVYASRISSLDTIYPNISVNGVDVGGLTVAEAAEKLAAEGADPYQGASLSVLFPLDRELTVTASALGLGSDISVPAEAAYAYGKGGSAMENLRAYMACRRTPVALQWDVQTQIDEEALHDLVSLSAAEVNTELLNADAQIGEDGITLIKGMNTAKVDIEAVCELVREAFLARDFSDIECELVDTAADGAAEAENVLQSVYETVYVEPVNAMYDKETGGATESERGVSFDMDDAKRRWNAADTGDEVFIPFVFTEPEIDAETLLARIFADCLAEKSTSLSGSSSNRINNVTLAAQALNDTVVNPGETFDYNACLGERTAAKGYREAGAYSGGRHVTSLGGGICQDSSTLYYCAIYSNLNITVRDCHYFVVSYLPWGMDATVSWGGPDFRFVNSRDYPIKIKAWVSGGNLTVQIWGTDEDGSYVRMTSDTWEDSEYYYAQTYRTVYAADGTQLSSQKEAYSRYHKYEAGEETPAPVQDEETPPPAETEAPAATEAPQPETQAPQPAEQQQTQPEQQEQPAEQQEQVQEQPVQTEPEAQPVLQQEEAQQQEEAPPESEQSGGEGGE